MVGMIMMPMTRPADSALKMSGDDRRRPDGPATIGVTKRQGEEAVDHRGDAGEHLEHRLEDLAHAGLGVLAEVDRGAETERDGDHDAR